MRRLGERSGVRGPERKEGKIKRGEEVEGKEGKVKRGEEKNTLGDGGEEGEK